MDKKEFWKKLRPYNPEQYVGEPLSKLTLVGITKLNDSQIEASYDNITVVLFKLFPESFSLITFPEYPDTLRVNRALTSHCITAGYIDGNQKKNNYVLTGKGRQIVDDLLDRLETNSNSKSKESDKRRNKYIKLVKAVTETSGFKNFRAGKFEEIKKFDLCECLHCTINADENHLRQNYDSLLYYAESCRKFEKFSEVSQWVLDYLEYLQMNWEKLVNG